MTLERVLLAAIASMVHGHHAPHCYRAHVPVDDRGIVLCRQCQPDHVEVDSQDGSEAGAAVVDLLVGLLLLALLWAFAVLWFTFTPPSVPLFP